MTTDLYTEDFKDTPWWWEAAPTSDADDELPEETEVAVVGGGFAGLSTALELARNDTEVVVLEAEAFGHGASSRNGGAVSGTNVGKGTSGAGNSPVERALGAEKMRELLAGGGQAMANLETLVEREGIDCDYARRGRFTGAYTPTHYALMAHKVAQLNAGGEAEAALLPRSEQRREIATDFYFGGMTIERAGGVHPAKLQMGLLRRCRELGVRLRSHAPVTGIARDGAG
ncbi:MAG: FAD-dependent oxidoreductase, partial [Alphaproteobacteria bacterium]|nr:FAD-dependent oxidoreductase [Alphaproteobacteria bacterium]